ncbi:MAG TPA: helix-hairpin-helix domain-containing protein [Bryobacteraceae bacterium]|nr:helix-hairpin-helix domain-containing protein [Bryobacteraceae bacterium]
MKGIDRIPRGRLARAFAMTLAAATLALPQDAVLPDGKGRDKVENACTVCHTADRIMAQHLTVDQWRSEVRTMVENGASLNPDEWEPVVAYLSKNFGPPINLNTASAKQIAEGLPFTDAEAAAIVAWRTANGPFRDIKDVKKVPGVDQKKIEAQQTRITF